MAKKKIVYEDKFTCECGEYEVDFTKYMYSLDGVKNILCPKCHMKYYRYKDNIISSIDEKGNRIVLEDHLNGHVFSPNISNMTAGYSHVTEASNIYFETKNNFKPKTEYKVEDDGIYKTEYESRDIAKNTCIMTKEAFIEAFNKYIKNE